MTKDGRTISFPEPAQVEEEAALWVVRLSERVLSAEEQAEFEAWKRKSTRHAETFNRLRAQWDDLDALGSLSGPTSAAEDAGVRTARPLGAWAAALVAALALGGGAWVMFGAREPQQVQVAALVTDGAFETTVGEREAIEVADGSEILLNTASRAEIDLTPEERKVNLLEGEAYFKVAHDKSRPFRVYSHEGVVEAVGTAFSVQVEGDSLRLVVEEGKVAYIPADESDDGPVVYVAAGQSATFAARRKVIETLDPETIERKLSWRGGRLTFSGEPLSEMVHDVSRYTNVSIEIADPQLASMRMGGYLEIGDIDGMLAALEDGFGLEVERIDETHVRIVSAAE
ncbi:MAG: FecR domain-containing protein [Hyphomonadaceae bacterium]